MQTFSRNYSVNALHRNVRTMRRLKNRLGHWWDRDECENIISRVEREGVQWIDQGQAERITELNIMAWKWPRIWDQDQMDFTPLVINEYGRKKPETA